MKNLDILNIREELRYRKNSPNFYEEEIGDLSQEEIKKKSTEELERILETFNNSKIPEIKSLVDQIFQKFSTDPKDNMIVLSGAYKSEDWTLCDLDALEEIEFDGLSHSYDKQIYYPIGWNCDLDNLSDEFFNLTDELNMACLLVGIPFAMDYFEDHNKEDLNSEWFGVIGIMKDYKVVAFVIRNDGLLESEEGVMNVIMEL